MLSRLPLFLAAVAIAMAQVACSSLTRPDEIVITKEAPAPTVIKQLPAAAAAAARPRPAPDPAGGGG